MLFGQTKISCVSHLRALKPALPSRLLTLVALWQVRLTLDLLLPAGKAGLCQSLSRLSSLSYTPIRIHRHTVNGLGTMGPVSVDVTPAFTLYIPLVDHVRTDLGHL